VAAQDPRERRSAHRIAPERGRKPAWLWQAPGQDNAHNGDECRNAEGKREQRDARYDPNADESGECEWNEGHCHAVILSPFCVEPQIGSLQVCPSCKKHHRQQDVSILPLVVPFRPLCGTRSISSSKPGARDTGDGVVARRGQGHRTGVVDATGGGLTCAVEHQCLRAN